MLLDDAVFLLCQARGLGEDGLRRADLANVVQQPRLADDLDVLGVQLQFPRQRRRVFGHMVGVREGIVVLSVNGGGEGVNGGGAVFGQLALGLQAFGPAAVLAFAPVAHDLVFAAALGRIERHARVGEQLVHIDGVARVGADAGAESQELARLFAGAQDLGVEPVARMFGAGRRVGRRAEREADRELLAAVARDRAAAFGQAAQRFAKAFEDAVALGGAVQLVVQLEIVKADDHQRELLVAAEFKFFKDMVLEIAAVVQVGQRVALGFLFQRFVQQGVVERNGQHRRRGFQEGHLPLGRAAAARRPLAGKDRERDHPLAAHDRLEQRRLHLLEPVLFLLPHGAVAAGAGKFGAGDAAAGLLQQPDERVFGRKRIPAGQLHFGTVLHDIAAVLRAQENAGGQAGQVLLQKIPVEAEQLVQVQRLADCGAEAADLFLLFLRSFEQKVAHQLAQQRADHHGHGRKGQRRRDRSQLSAARDQAAEKRLHRLIPVGQDQRGTDDRQRIDRRVGGKAAQLHHAPPAQHIVQADGVDAAGKRVDRQRDHLRQRGRSRADKHDRHTGDDRRKLAQLHPARTAALADQRPSQPQREHGHQQRQRHPGRNAVFKAAFPLHHGHVRVGDKDVAHVEHRDHKPEDQQRRAHEGAFGLCIAVNEIEDRERHKKNAGDRDRIPELRPGPDRHAHEQRTGRPGGKDAELDDEGVDQPVFARGQHGQQQQQVADQRDQRHDDEKAFVEGHTAPPSSPACRRSRSSTTSRGAPTGGTRRPVRAR